MVSNESVDYRATFPEGIFQFIVLRNTYLYTTMGYGHVISFWFSIDTFIKIENHLPLPKKQLFDTELHISYF
jgi:hypothetical protein